jgi:hypothetical protein
MELTTAKSRPNIATPLLGTNRLGKKEVKGRS